MGGGARAAHVPITNPVSTLLFSPFTTKFLFTLPLVNEQKLLSLLYLGKLFILCQ